MNIKISELKNIAKKALSKLGYDKKESEIILEILMYAQLRGNNQGLVKLIGGSFNKNPEAGKIIIDKETKLSALINGNDNVGMVTLKKAMELAIHKAKRYGFGIVGTKNTSSSTGAIGYYANEIAKSGYLGFVFAGSPETVSTYGSYEPIFGTNPLAIGIPSVNNPLVLDMATATMAYYGLIEANTAGRKISPDVAFDKDGKSTTNPKEAMEGALRPFDRSYKGAGLSMMVEVLTGPLVGASFTGIGNTKSNWGNLIFIIDPDLLTNLNLLKKQTKEMINKIKKTKKLPGVKEIFYPGERGNKLTQERIKSGNIDIEDNLFNKLKQVAES